ncbi:GntR family transcriptional regulator [Phytohabitans sp. ZYX-F-186]|uniref:GntR family transcriptional regulator n=1 Tax=Phytohabitans maris TaxID=3071409 RepID=A0ABU0ZCB9_9ACTN|nr:GntR family transcriptional regulator [Phytohabitans sp. ZYX-F-186]MDQ7904628.1 GntR family transcriptional regulator [Phytohabitans sp. ZYX-F-186]
MSISTPVEPFEDSSEPGTVLRARRELAAAIRRGDYQPNQRLIESELTATLGISRPTLRAVFVALEQENYISLERNRGARVRQFSPAEAIEILETREILESAAAGLAAARILPQECDRLDTIIEQMIEMDRTGNGRQYSAYNREFHALIITAARQPTLSRFISATPYPLVMSQYRNQATRHPRDGSLREHQAILAALRTNNRLAAEAAMRHHLAATRRALTIKTAPQDRS